jgi:hypothetical protein
MARTKGAKTKKQVASKVNLNTPYCTCCGQTDPKEFYNSKSKIHKHTEKLSLCKKCIGDLFDYYMKRCEYQKKAVFYICRKLDVPFNISAYNGAETHSNKVGWKIWQSYFKELNSLGDTNKYGYCFDDGQQFFDDTDIISKNPFEYEEADDEQKLFWGYGFDPHEYAYLEHELSEWQKTHKCDNRSELTLLKEICIKLLEIRKKRESGENVSSEQKSLQELMKTANVDPAKSNMASAGKSHDCFGIWVKEIEQFRPAEWYEQQEKYKDMDGFIPYIRNYIVRPIENFITGIRNFVVDDDIDADLDNIDIGSGDFSG